MDNVALWEEWYETDSSVYIGGEIEYIRTHQDVVRGPLASITIKDNTLIFGVHWLARCTTKHRCEPSKWEIVGNLETRYLAFSLCEEDIALISRPYQGVPKRTWFFAPFSEITLYTAEENVLEPELIHGFKK